MERKWLLEKIESCFKSHTAVALLGPRQVGKTTLAKAYANHLSNTLPVHHFDLEDPIDLARLETAKLTLQPLTGLIVIDEIQLRPDLFPLLRVLIDEKVPNKFFLILGSASPQLIKQSSETLAGRLAYIEMPGFTLRDTPDIQRLWSRGGFPKSYTALTDKGSVEWRKNYIRSFLERDIPNLGIRIPAPTLRRFWMMLTHYHGNVINFSELGRSLGQAHTTIRHYVDILEQTFMVRTLQPWYVNIKKRQVKSPKLYFTDSGILNTLSSLETFEDLQTFPRLGAYWEGFALEQVIQSQGYEQENCFFWGVHGQAELDLLVFKGGKAHGYEFKYADAPKLTTSMKQAMEHLELDRLSVIYPGDKTYLLSEHIAVVPLNQLRTEDVKKRVPSGT